MVRTSTARIGLGVAAVALAVAGTIATSPSASAAKPDTTCQRAGIATLQGAGLLDDVARDGLPISLAVGLGVTPRPSTDVSTLPDPLPLSVVLADHRAGANSLFGILLVRLRVAEIGHHPVTEIFCNKTTRAGDHFGAPAVIRANDVAQLLRVKPPRQGGGANEVDEHDRELAAFRGVRGFRRH